MRTSKACPASRHRSPWRSATCGFLIAAVIPLVVVPPPAGAVGADLVIEGRGWGHGVGLAQDGALAMGRGGADVGQILDHFYPGTTDGTAAGVVRVAVPAGGERRIVVSFPGGGQLRVPGPVPQPPGFPLEVAPNTPVEVSVDSDRTVVRPPAPQPGVRPASTRDGAVPVVLAAYTGQDTGLPPSTPEPTTAGPTVTTPRPTTTAPPAKPAPANAPAPGARPPPPAPTSAPVAPAPQGGDPGLVAPGAVLAVPTPGQTSLLVDRNRRYRGTLEIGMVGGATHVVNELDVEDYLRGMGEVREPSWPAAALQAQAVAARTYALHAMATGGEICGDDRCQVYLSAEAEYPAMDEAVRTTRGRVRRVGAGLATTFYSANGGGVSATPEEGFGPGGDNLSYLRAEPYKTDDPEPWTVRMAPDEAGRRLRYGARLSSARVSRAGPSGRALEVTLDGEAGSMTLSGQDFSARLQLRSTLFTFGVAGAGPAPGAMVPSAPPVDGVEGALPVPGAQTAGVRVRPSGGGSGLLPMVILVLLGAAAGVFRRSRRQSPGDGSDGQSGSTTALAARS